MSAISGQWVTEGFGAIVQIRPCKAGSSELCADLVWAWDAERVKPNAFDRPMLWGGYFDSKSWQGVRLQNPMDGRRYRGEIHQLDANRLRLKGCVAKILCKSQLWWRLAALPHVAGIPSESEARDRF